MTLAEFVDGRCDGVADADSAAWVTLAEPVHHRYAAVERSTRAELHG